ncbi:hypothetical protein EL17_14230 [Anditalea andensis]|uniref:Uncharacterized protein n=1 Tax=Anditalea andensis TaxID=1048983 RepID=A0A074KV43_9BACT|nr:hypothetical protein EL17_14230 [Anditalea andensis]
MFRIVFYIVLLLVAFGLLLYSLYQMNFSIDPDHPGFLRLMAQALIFLGIVGAFISVLKSYKKR